MTHGGLYRYKPFTEFAQLLYADSLLSPTDKKCNVCKAKVVMVNVQVTEAAAVQVLQ